MIVALDQGAVDVTQTATPYLIQAVLRGSDAIGIASETANPIYSLIVKPEIASFADLKGKLLGLSLPVDTISISMRKLLALKGLGEADYRVKELVGTPVRFECLRRGECDGVPLGQPDDLIALTQGYRRLGMSTEAVSAFQFQLLAVKRSWAAANNDALVRFVRAIASSFRFIRDPANRDEVVKAMVAVTGSSEDIARQTLALYFEPDRGVMPKQGEINIAGLAQVIAFMGDGGMLAQPLPRPERFIDLQYLKAAGVGVGQLLFGCFRGVPQRVHLGQRRILRPLALRRQRLLDRAKAPREFLVGGAQRRLRIGIEMAGEIDHGEQQVADLGRGLAAVAAAISASISSHSSRILASTASGSFQSKPTLPALACSFSARVRAVIATGTPASAPVSSGLPPRAARSAFSSALMRSHSPSTSSGDRPRASPNTCGCRRSSFSVMASTTPPKSNAPCSCAMRAWNTTWSRRSPSSSRRSARSPRSIASATS